MFTGLITNIGFATKIIISDNQDTLLRIDIKWQNDIDIGSSICCNGVCLTVIDKTENYFEVEFSNETLQRTNFKQLKINDKINLERSLHVGQEMGGHIVTGHIDDIAILTKINSNKSSYELTFETKDDIISFLAEKGSIALNGVSLTINRVFRNSFNVNIIKHTWDNTNLSNLELGSSVNLEIDIISRYVNRHLNFLKNKQ
jgi:riboflavin synthase